MKMRGDSLATHFIAFQPARVGHSRRVVFACGGVADAKDRPIARWDIPAQMACLVDLTRQLDELLAIEYCRRLRARRIVGQYFRLQTTLGLEIWNLRQRTRWSRVCVDDDVAIKLLHRFRLLERSVKCLGPADSRFGPHD